jgi:NAD(P)-dependent dehydrogenase (short-subunit alcohol dehydrogenase family)
VVQAAGGRVAGLVHLAGVFEPDPDGARDPGVWERAMAHNLTNAYTLANACVEALDESVVGRFVFLSSLAYRRGSWQHVPYAVAKAGLVGLVRALARRLAPAVRVNGLAPGLIDTPMPARLIAERGLDNVVAEIPLKRLGHPREVAGVIAFLMSDDASYITGQIINVDGGIVNS